MRKPVLTIFYQFNPWNSTIGGIKTLINTSRYCLCVSNLQLLLRHSQQVIFLLIKVSARQYLSQYSLGYLHLLSQQRYL